MIYDTINDARTVAGNAEGTILAGRYRIVKPLGQGGMGSVWLAEDTQLDDKPFAIKMLPSILVSNKRAYRQLKDEALVAMKLTHPNIVTLRAFEENNGNPFLVMDYVDGQTLDDFLTEHAGGLAEADVLRILRPIAAALDYAHAKGVVHRDVKPGNVMIAKDGTPYILDFGIAREIQETMTRVTGKLSSGTLLYMSPEQLMGEQPKPVQDVYSFAAMVYECLKGEPPFARGAIEEQIKNKQPDPLPGGPRSCAAAVMAGLAKKPEDRPATCTAVLEGSGFSRVEHVERVEGGDGRARSPSGPQSGKWKFLFLAVVLGLAVAGGVTWWVVRDDSSRKTARHERSPKAEETRNTNDDDAVNDKSLSAMATTDRNAAKIKALREQVTVVTNVNSRSSNPPPVTHSDVITLNLNADGEVSMDGQVFTFEDVASRLARIATKSPGLAVVIRADTSCSYENVMSLVNACRESNVQKLSLVPSGSDKKDSGSVAAVTNRPSAPKPPPQPTWEETQRAVNDAKRHVVFIRKRVASVMEETIKPYRAHAKYFDEILAAINGQHEALQKLKDPTTIDEARRFTTDAEKIADEIENKGVEKLKKRLKFCVSEEIRSAKAFFEKSERGEGDYWNEVIAAAGRALALEPSNDDAEKIKKDAESHLVPTMRVVAKINGREISGAIVKAGDESFTTPVVWKLKKGSRYGPYAVSYESGGKHYSGTIESVTVDWSGQRPVSVELKERTEPEDGECRAFMLPGGVRMEMVYVAPGSFQMGSSSGNKDETPHRVRLTKGYWIGKYPVTQAQWSALVSGTGVSFDEGRPVARFSKKGGGSYIVSGMDTSEFPMGSISWNDCKVLVDALNKTDHEGRHWSLPTEAQWEFAARGGNKSRGYTYSGGNDMDAVGWYYENSGMRRLSDSNWEIEDLKSNRCRPHSVKEKDIGNELGIVGMSGNVWEWCNDWYGENYYSNSPTEDPQGPASGVSRVLRGGCWDGIARCCRSASRCGDVPDGRHIGSGFRLCCSAGPRE